jgi:hypothetical protein
MNRRLLFLLMTVVLVIGLVVPALGQVDTVAPTIDRQSMARAVAKARLALLTARSAKSESRRAARTAQAAVNTANDAKGIATTTQASLDSTKVQSAVAAGGVTTDSPTFVQLSGGPSVTVTVPSSGLIEVWAQATMTDAGAVSLYEDGQQMAGQDEEICGDAGFGVLFAGAPFGPGPTVTIGTPAVASFGGCGTTGAPGPVMFQTTPGTHTYELRYTFDFACSCGGTDVTFTNRLLRVAPRL